MTASAQIAEQHLKTLALADTARVTRRLRADHQRMEIRGKRELISRKIVDGKTAGANHQ